MIPQEPEVHTIARDESGKLALQRSVSRKGSQRGSRKASKERTSLGEQNGAKLEASKSDNPHGAGEALKGIAWSQYLGINADLQLYIVSHLLSQEVLLHILLEVPLSPICPLNCNKTVRFSGWVTLYFYIN